MPTPIVQNDKIRREMGVGVEEKEELRKNEEDEKQRQWAVACGPFHG